MIFVPVFAPASELTMPMIFVPVFAPASELTPFLPPALGQPVLRVRTCAEDGAGGVRLGVAAISCASARAVSAAEKGDIAARAPAPIASGSRGAGPVGVVTGTGPGGRHGGHWRSGGREGAG